MPSAIAMPVVAMPSTGSVGGSPRKEDVYESNLIDSNAVMPTQLDLFADAASFTPTTTGTSTGFTKRQGRDTNLPGSGNGSLPKSTHLFWYEISLLIHAMGSNLATNANKGVSEELKRYREISFFTFEFGQSKLFRAKCIDLPDGVGPAWGFTTQSDTVVYGPNCVPDRRGKVVTVNGKPASINEQQDISANVQTPQGGFNPTVDLFVTVRLIGLLLRGIVP